MVKIIEFVVLVEVTSEFIGSSIILIKLLLNWFTDLSNRLVEIVFNVYNVMFPRFSIKNLLVIVLSQLLQLPWDQT